jgi:hypothetical protein
MIEFKNEKDKMLFSLLHPAIIMIYSDLYLYAKEKHNVNLVVTQTISDKEQDQALNRVSDSHRTGRAIDIRTKDLDITIINDLVEYINTRWVYKKYHYTARSGVKRLAYYHVGSAEHIHLAIGAQFSQNINIAGL